MSAKDFNPTGAPRRWAGVPGVKYPENVVAEKLFGKDEQCHTETARVSPPGYVELRTVTMMLKCSESTARKVLEEYSVPSVLVRPLHGCNYRVYCRSAVQAAADARRAKDKRWRGVEETEFFL